MPSTNSYTIIVWNFFMSPDVDQKLESLQQQLFTRQIFTRDKFFCQIEPKHSILPFDWIIPVYYSRIIVLIHPSYSFFITET